MPKKTVVLAKSMIDPQKAKIFLEQNCQKKMRFQVWACGNKRIDVYLHPDGTVIAYNDNGQLVGRVAECLDNNIGLNLNVGVMMLALITEVYSEGTMVKIHPLPFGNDFWVISQERIMAGEIKAGQIIPVWIKSIDHNQKIEFCIHGPEK